LFPIHVNIQRAGQASAHSNWSAKLTFDIVLEAHGLHFDVVSKKAAFDLDIHMASNFGYEYTSFPRNPDLSVPGTGGRCRTFLL